MAKRTINNAEVTPESYTLAPTIEINRVSLAHDIYIAMFSQAQYWGMGSQDTAIRESIRKAYRMADIFIEESNSK